MDVPKGGRMPLLVWRRTVPRLESSLWPRDMVDTFRHAVVFPFLRGGSGPWKESSRTSPREELVVLATASGVDCSIDQPEGAVPTRSVQVALVSRGHIGNVPHVECVVLPNGLFTWSTFSTCSFTTIGRRRSRTVQQFRQVESTGHVFALRLNRPLVVPVQACGLRSTTFALPESSVRSRMRRQLRTTRGLALNDSMRNRSGEGRGWTSRSEV